MSTAEPVRPAPPGGIIDPIEDPEPGDGVSTGDRPDPFTRGLGKDPVDD